MKNVNPQEPGYPEDHKAQGCVSFWLQQDPLTVEALCKFPLGSQSPIYALHPLSIAETIFTRNF